MARKTSGFTIVELLIVIVVIAILAAITIVAYNGIQERSRASAVSSALSQAAKKLALYQVDNPDQYPAAAGTNGLDNLASLGISSSSNTTYQYSSSNGTYCLTATIGTTSYKLSNSSSTPTVGGCAGHGQGGAPAVTNLVTNPSFETASGTVNGQPGLAGVSYHGTNGSLAYQTNVWAQSGTRSLHITPSTNGSVDTFAQIPTSWFTPALQPGGKISVAGYIRLTQSGSVTQDGRARRIHMVFNTPSGSVIVQTNPDQTAPVSTSCEAS